MRNSSWKGWFGAEVGFSIYIHRRGFTSPSTIHHPPSTINHQSSISATYFPRRVGAARRARLRALRVRAPCEFAPTRWATPPYRGHKAKFAPCETPPGWIGLVLKLDSLYIYIGGVSHHHQPSLINQCYLPPKACGRVAPGGRTRPARALGVRTNTLGNPSILGSFTPLLRGLCPRLRGVAACAGRSGLLSTVARDVASRHDGL